MYKVLIPQDIPESGKSYLRERGYEIIHGSGFDVDTLKREIVDVDAVIARTAYYPEGVIKAGRKLKIISRHGVGFDNIDIKAAEKQGVWVTVTKNTHTSYAVAEHALTMFLMLAKKMPVFLPAVSADHWNIRLEYLTNELQGKTLGLIGCGAIGQRLASMMHFGLEMDVIGYDAFLDYEKLPDFISGVSSPEDIYRKADFISLHVPLTENTKNMIGKEALSQMKPTACLVNCARGGIVNEDDLYEALAAGKLGGAGCDCFSEEPFDSRHPILQLKNFVSTPHNAGMSQEAQDASGMISAMAIDDVFHGRKPRYPVNCPEL